VAADLRNALPQSSLAAAMDPSTLTSDRLCLRHAEPARAAALADYMRRNRDHLARWSPPAATDLETPAGWVPLLVEAVAQRAEGTALRWVLTPRDDATHVIGRISFTNVQRGPLQSCFLGYQIDHACEGRGLMHEALGVAIEHAFGALRLHRIEANYRPENERSGRLLMRLGFERTGYAPRYLFIDGDWRDHVQTQRLNPHFDRRWLMGATAGAAAGGPSSELSGATADPAPGTTR
jgi:[ribosomal protein S5]-alanine N-acetyltransferase